MKNYKKVLCAYIILKFIWVISSSPIDDSNFEKFQNFVSKSEDSSRDELLRIRNDDQNSSSICWAESLIITENKINKTKTASKSYSILMDSQEKLQQLDKNENVSCIEILDYNAKPIKKVNSTKISETEESIVKEYQSLFCGAGPIIPQNFMIWPILNSQKIVISINPLNSTKWKNCHNNKSNSERTSSYQSGKNVDSIPSESTRSMNLFPDGQPDDPPDGTNRIEEDSEMSSEEDDLSTQLGEMNTSDKENLTVAMVQSKTVPNNFQIQKESKRRKINNNEQVNNREDQIVANKQNKNKKVRGKANNSVTLQEYVKKPRVFKTVKKKLQSDGTDEEDSDMSEEDDLSTQLGEMNTDNKDNLKVAVTQSKAVANNGQYEKGGKSRKIKNNEHVNDRHDQIVSNKQNKNKKVKNNLQSADTDEEDSDMSEEDDLLTQLGEMNTDNKENLKVAVAQSKAVANNGQYETGGKRRKIKNNEQVNDRQDQIVANKQNKNKKVKNNLQSVDTDEEDSDMSEEDDLSTQLEEMNAGNKENLNVAVTQSKAVANNSQDEKEGKSTKLKTNEQVNDREDQIVGNKQNKNKKVKGKTNNSITLQEYEKKPEVFNTTKKKLQSDVSDEEDSDMSQDEGNDIVAISQSKPVKNKLSSSLENCTLDNLGNCRDAKEKSNSILGYNSSSQAPLAKWFFRDLISGNIPLDRDRSFILKVNTVVNVKNNMENISFADESNSELILEKDCLYVIPKN